jgi:hypothetical protein
MHNSAHEALTTAGDLVREIVHLPMAGGLELNFSLVNHPSLLIESRQ